ncbi:MAG: acyl-ACP--UDP-N-acetylglucosamine O-acyltransferase [Candidatus Caenarcaniphilales bacterium]|nr:acyl-ACP--UDP-N-acetylglucosamine O-acyltransferase [Candidatus Caenarcaniphilales bacterium]
MSVIYQDKVRISPTAIIEEGVEIGAGTSIAEHVIIRKGTKIGKNCKIFPYAVLGEEPQDKSYKGEETGLIIGDDNIIREFVTLHRAVGSGNNTIVGNNNFLMVNVHFGHNCKIGNNCTFANAVSLAGHVIVEDNVTIGGSSVVHQHCRIGKFAMIAGMSGLNHDALPFMTYCGMPAGGISTNRIAMKRAGFEQAVCSEIMRAFKVIYGRKSTLPNIMENLSKLESIPEIVDLIEFMKNSKRGIVLGRMFGK